jgi:hypothetical protein
MSRDEHYSPFASAPGPRISTQGELVYEFLHGHTRVRCELVDHGQYGVARILYNEEHHMSHTFAPWHCIPFVTQLAAAIHWAETERKAIGRRGV